MKFLTNNEYNKLLNTIESLTKKAAENDSLKSDLVTFLGGYRHNTREFLRKEKAKVKPREKVVYATEEQGHLLAEIQNRIMDGEFFS